MQDGTVINRLLFSSDVMQSGRCKSCLMPLYPKSRCNVETTSFNGPRSSALKRATPGESIRRYSTEGGKSGDSSIISLLDFSQASALEFTPFRWARRAATSSGCKGRLDPLAMSQGEGCASVSPARNAASASIFNARTKAFFLRAESWALAFATGLAAVHLRAPSLKASRCVTPTSRELISSLMKACLPVDIPQSPFFNTHSGRLLAVRTLFDLFTAMPSSSCRCLFRSPTLLNSWVQCFAARCAGLSGCVFF